MRPYQANKAILRRPNDGEHVGVGGIEAANRIMALTASARSSGCTRYLADHLFQLAPCLAMIGPPNDTLVSRADVQRMIGEVFAAYERRLPAKLKDLERRG